jgi:hypothetical protein
MEKVTKIQEDELKRLQEFQVKSEQLVSRLGQLEFQKIRIAKDEKFLKEQIDLLEEEEIAISKLIKDTYGNVNIDLKTGDLTYSQE